ncbi:hypothetical protein [Micromonospora noduli]|uniref:Uncharacterized protein n=1 Tax=Micromonospora noduli TaxID=709876 RepID=A0A328MZE8_9ACTN|nr:hypothetical protein [Micromonospora noduli]RAN94809.1 hypothetical protein LAH08_05696 [Micromonospora noduli]
MNDTTAYALALVLTGGPAAMLAPFAVARLLVDQHAHQVADDNTRLADVPTVATTRRELINR